MAQRNRHVLNCVVAGTPATVRSQRPGLLASSAALLFVESLSATALGAENDAWVLPTLVAPCATCSASTPNEADPAVSVWARQLDSLLSEAVLDLGLAPDVTSEVTDDRSEPTLVEAARERWVVSPVLAPEGGDLFIRLSVVAPGSNVVLVRAARVHGDELEVNAVVMMRDLVRAGQGKPGLRDVSPAQPAHRVVTDAPSEGRAVLALNGAALGGYIGFALQRAAGSSDARLTYPLIALGTGLGLGASMIIADEWDLGVGDAWYLSAGAWWPTFAALLLSEGYDEPSDSRYVYSLGATVGGLGLSTFALTFGRMSSGGAVLTHSGGAYGTLVGGLSQMLYEGRADVTPTRGMGWGAGAGVLTAGIAARLLPPLSASRVLLIDLGVGVGGLTGAALSSPLVFSDEDKTKNRLFLSSIATGMVAGAVTSYLLTIRDEKSAAKTSALLMPWVGVVEGAVDSAPGGGIQGVF